MVLVFPPARQPGSLFQKPKPRVHVLREVCFHFVHQAEMGLIGKSEGAWAAGEQEERVDLGCLA